MKTCEDKHRKFSLESLFLHYQILRDKDVDEEKANKRQGELWEILDNYYQQLPIKSEQSKSDKHWRLFLVRMDRRKMNITTKKTDGGIAIQFNPEIDSDMKKYHEDHQKTYNEQIKYLPLQSWAEFKFNNNDKYKQYEKYENDPLLALQEVKDILVKLNTIKIPETYEIYPSEEESFFLLNNSIPVYVCSVLVEKYLDELSIENRSFCKDVILEVATISSLNTNYQYQIFDGVQQAFSILPVLLELFPDEKGNIKRILLLSLLNNSHVDILSSKNFSIFSIKVIQKLWDNNFSDAQSLLFGYLLLKPKYNELRKSLQNENHKKGIYESIDDQFLNRFIEENEKEIQCVINNDPSLFNLKDIEKLDLSTLIMAFQMIPQKTNSNDHKMIAKIVTSIFIEKLILDTRKDRINDQVKRDFLQTYAYFVLNASNEEIQNYLKPFLDHFNTSEFVSEFVADLFREFVLAEDVLNTYDNFWLVWNVFKEKIINICKEGDGRWYAKKIVKSYLFATVTWKETTKEWHSLKDNNKKFFKELSENIGHCPSALYAISKLLNNIGSHYIDDGVFWIATIIGNNRDLDDKEPENNTIYYIEKITRQYIYINREKIKRTKIIKDELILILDYLIEKGSVVGYMLRESIV